MSVLYLRPAARYSRQRVTGESEGGPFVHVLRADLLVEIDRQLVPVQHGPVETPAIPIHRDARQLAKQSEANAMLAKHRLDEEVFEIDTALAEPC